MKEALIVGIGGFLGTIARWLLGGAILHRFPDLKFPLGTFIINLLGCLLIGVLAGLAERKAAFSPELRLFLFTGICGGFTTFSAFALENVFLLRRGEAVTAGLYVAASIIAGLSAVWLGYRCLAPR